MSFSRFLAVIALTAASAAQAQQPPAGAQPAAAPTQPAPRIPRATASTRASVQVLIDSRWDAREGGWFGALNLAGPAKIAIDYGVYGVPETFIVGRDGKIAYKLVGPITSENINTVLNPEIEMALRAGP